MGGARRQPSGYGPRRRASMAVGTAALVVGGLLACVTKDDAKKLVESLEASRPSRPDVLPVMINREVPVQYPAALYGRKAQGNVALRIFIDSTGRVHPESTVVVQSSGEPAFDSAAIGGVRGLQFVPAQRHGQPVAVSVLFPIYFRHPQGGPVPGDSVLHRRPDSASARVGGSTRPPAHPGRVGTPGDSAVR
jgi:TonB family protein